MFRSSCPDLLLFRLTERHSTPFQGNRPIGSIPVFARLRRTHQSKVVDAVPWSRNEGKFPELSSPNPWFWFWKAS
jgi:hypothetical protein